VGYIEAVRKRYTAVGSRTERQAIINEVVANLIIYRKSAIRTLERKPRNYTTSKTKKNTQLNQYYGKTSFPTSTHDLKRYVKLKQKNQLLQFVIS
jgi:hypothetical protein